MIQQYKQNRALSRLAELAEQAEAAMLQSSEDVVRRWEADRPNC